MASEGLPVACEIVRWGAVAATMSCASSHWHTGLTTREARRMSAARTLVSGAQRGNVAPGGDNFSRDHDSGQARRLL
jgi:hypothetical protein